MGVASREAPRVSCITQRVATLELSSRDPLAIEAIAAIRSGELETLTRLLHENAGLARARIIDNACIARNASRTLLHIATDWPGHFPNGSAIVAALIAAGAEVNAPFTGRHAETPLHWAASSNDVAVLDALLDAGADIEAPGGVIGGGTPLGDAVAFGQWQAASRLLERGARTTLWEAAALGLMAHIEERFIGEGSLGSPRASPPPAQAGAPTQREITHAFWWACHGGQHATAEYLLRRGADLNWIGYDGLAPIDAACRSGAKALVEWLRSRGAKAARELR